MRILFIDPAQCIFKHILFLITITLLLITNLNFPTYCASLPFKVFLCKIYPAAMVERKNAQILICVLSKNEGTLLKPISMNILSKQLFSSAVFLAKDAKLQNLVLQRLVYQNDYLNFVDMKYSGCEN